MRRIRIPRTFPASRLVQWSELISRSAAYSGCTLALDSVVSYRPCFNENLNMCGSFQIEPDSNLRVFNISNYLILNIKISQNSPLSLSLIQGAFRTGWESMLNFRRDHCAHLESGKHQRDSQKFESIISLFVQHYYCTQNDPTHVKHAFLHSNCHTPQ